MKLVATVLHPGDLEGAARMVAETAGLAFAEARMRLSREPPALLAPLEAEKADALAARLREHGLAALAVDAHVPSDRNRIVARTIEFSREGVTFSPRFGEPMQVAWPELIAVLRGARESRKDADSVERINRPSGWAAWVTNGLWVTTTKKKTFHSHEGSVEQVILVFARDGRTAMVAEDQFEFASLGAMQQPSSTASLAQLAQKLRENATAAFYDERLVRLGCRPLPFVANMESRSQSSVKSVFRTDTSATFDVLAEVMRQALLAGLLP